MPGEVFFTIDLRDPDAAVLDRHGKRDCRAGATASASELGLQIAIKTIWPQPPVRVRCRTASPRCAQRRQLSGYSARDMISGAGHDAAYVSRVAPAAMIFVPCKDGISHNEAEFSSKEQCAAGAQVLLQAVLDYDRHLAERYGG